MDKGKPVIAKSLDRVAQTDLQALVDNKVDERRTIEFKRTLPGASDADKRELCADVSSFANSAGGDLLFGIDEEDSVAKDLTGVKTAEINASVLRIEQILQSGIEPRVPGLQLKSIAISDDRSILVVRIARSWRGPHFVRVNDAHRMYGRTSKGKYLFDASEIRSAILSADSLTERWAEWRNDRIAKIEANAGPIPLGNRGRLIIHVAPLSSFAGRAEISAASLRQHQTSFRPPAVSGWDSRINLDGLLNYFSRGGSEGIAYCQAYRNGRVEAVTCEFVQERRNGALYVPSEWFEEAIVEWVQSYLTGLQSAGFEPPIVVQLTLTGASGAELASVGVFDRDILIFPDIVLDSLGDDLPEALHPMFDTIWNAAGGTRSPNFDTEGKFRGRRASLG